jgi:hypothetical protein
VLTTKEDMYNAIKNNPGCDWDTLVDKLELEYEPALMYSTWWVVLFKLFWYMFSLAWDYKIKLVTDENKEIRFYLNSKEIKYNE